MSLTPGSFRPAELAGADVQPGDAELAAAYSTARELEASMPPDVIHPSSSFVAGVMAAIEAEPAPRRSGFLVPFRARPGIAGFMASVRQAWTVAFSPAGRPVGARGLALAYVLAVLVIGASITGVAGYGAAGALGLLDPDRSPAPTLVPSPEPTPEATHAPPTATPLVTPEPTESEEPSTSPEASETPSPSGDDATAAPTASDDDTVPSPAPSASDDSDDPDDTPGPSDTPKPSQTPH